MFDPIAVLVEDDPQQSEVSIALLDAARFDVRNFDSIAPVLAYMRSSTELVDLFVLDRRLPVNVGEPATDELGDGLLQEVRSRYPDSRLIVFTGYADIRHVQETLRGGGQLPAVSGQQPIDRITVLEKNQSLEFKQQVEEFRQLVQTLDDIEISTPDAKVPLSYVDKRVLRRLAFGYNADSITAISLSGGMTGADVWKCEITRPEGHVATIVAKRVTEAIPLGGLPDLLPRVSTTSTMATLSGLMGGSYVNVLQIAGDDPYSLSKLISDNPARAVELVRPVWGALHAVAQQRRTLTVAEICESLIDWDMIAGRLETYGVDVPAGSLRATACIGLRHGDLHPANILIDNDQAVLIDFDSTTFAAGALDPVTMLISTLVHPSSPIRGALWPGAAEITASLGTADFGREHVCAAWFLAVREWIEECRTSDRELWALILAYVARQLVYPDVLSDMAVVERLVAIAKRAVGVLAST